MRGAVRRPLLSREPFLERLKPDTERLSPFKPLRFPATIGMDDDRDILGRFVVVAGFEAERHAVASVEPDHQPNVSVAMSQKYCADANMEFPLRAGGTWLLIATRG
jgi:hypothetical protein